MEQREINPKNIKIVIIVLTVMIIGIFLAISLYQIFRNNPYGPQIKVDNFDKFFADAPQSIKDLSYNNLYNAVAKSPIEQNKIPHSGAVIRDGSVNLDFNSVERYYIGTSIIDIPSIQQSYQLTIIWALGKDNFIVASEYPSEITCVTPDEMIYPDFGCKDFLEVEEIEEEKFYDKYPLAAKLPIRIEYYVDGYGAHVKYNIFSDIQGAGNDQTFSVLIEDYTGNNYEPALERIRNLGFNPDDYEIKYKDLSEEYAAPGYAGD